MSRPFLAMPSLQHVLEGTEDSEALQKRFDMIMQYAKAKPFPQLSIIGNLWQLFPIIWYNIIKSDLWTLLAVQSTNDRLLIALNGQEWSRHSQL